MSETVPKLVFSEVHRAIALESQLRAYGGIPFVDTDGELKLLVPGCYIARYPQNLREKANALYRPLKWFLQARARGY